VSTQSAPFGVQVATARIVSFGDGPGQRDYAARAPTWASLLCDWGVAERNMDEKGAGAILAGAAVVCYVLLLEVMSRVYSKKFQAAACSMRPRSS
jgi:hypothetical protein